MIRITAIWIEQDCFKGLFGTFHFWHKYFNTYPTFKDVTPGDTPCFY